MKQRLWFIAALIAATFTAATLTIHAQTGGTLHPLVYGSTASGGDLTLVSTLNATKGSIFLGAAQNSAYDEVNDRLGIGTTAPSVGLHGVVTNGAMLWEDDDSDDTNKYGYWGIEHYDVDEEPFYSIVNVTNTTANEIRIGGSGGIGNAATLIRLYTAANNTTTTGTERWRINSTGQLLTVSGSGVDIASSADDDTGILLATEDVNIVVGNVVKVDWGAAAMGMQMNTGLDMDGNPMLFDEGSDPVVNPDQVGVFARDNGGTTELCFEYPGGDLVCHADPVP